tara:strand:+ start:944 stop:1420 length:477 start_codon:yes stop_codon:yes gene_type:complete
MSYIRQKQVIYSKESNPSAQLIPDSYTEITGSRTELISLNTSMKFIYRFCFQIGLASSPSKWFLHIKLQSSNDNFTSHIYDIPGANYNVASDSQNADDNLYRLNTAFFVINNLTGKNHVRLVCRSYSNSLKPSVHESKWWDGVEVSRIFDPSLIVFEV